MVLATVSTDPRLYLQRQSLLLLLALWGASGSSLVPAPDPTHVTSGEGDTCTERRAGEVDGCVAEASRKRARSFIQARHWPDAPPIQAPTSEGAGLAGLGMSAASPSYIPVDVRKGEGFCGAPQLKQIGSDGSDDCAGKCEKESPCAFFSINVNSGVCRLYETCTKLTGNRKVWKSFKLQKDLPTPVCDESCKLHYEEEFYNIIGFEANCSKPECSGCEVCVQPAPVTRKRGYAHLPGWLHPWTYEECDDAHTLGLKDSWYYTWMPQPEAKWRCYRMGIRPAAEWVPMVLNCKQATFIWDHMYFFGPRWKQLGVKFLLGYNEPDGHLQTCSPEMGARAWLNVTKIANWFDPPLRLVSPCPMSRNFAHGKSEWLTEFFEHCSKIEGCNPDNIEFVAFHDYEGDFDIREDNMPNRIQGAVQNYRFTNGSKRQLWLTEFAAGCGKTSVCRDCKVQKKGKYYRNGNCRYPKNGYDGISAEEQVRFQNQIIPFLESSPDIFRYTWYGARKRPNPFIGVANLLPYDGNHSEMTIIGENYKNLPER